MNTLTLWFGTPLSMRSSIGLWLALTGLVFTAWFAVPILLGGFLESQYLTLSITPKVLAVVTGRAFGEEMVFRVLPIVIALRLFPKNIAVALLVGFTAALPFAIWHDRVYSATICLGLGGAILVLAFLKFGGASNKPFQALIACGAIHATCNLTAAVLADIFWF
jgi:Type II CAAX prenyl endopeptidase Rce1-like